MEKSCVITPKFNTKSVPFKKIHCYTQKTCGLGVKITHEKSTCKKGSILDFFFKSVNNAVNYKYGLNIIFLWLERKIKSGQ